MINPPVLPKVDKPSQSSIIGTSVPRTEGPDKVRGATQYVADIQRIGMLHGAVLRSPYAHARILSIDTSAAEALPGVRAVITAEDTPKKGWGAFIKDLYPLAVDKVRYVGDEVAAVAAVDLATAKEAVNLIEVEWEELPAILTMDEALAQDSVLIHDHMPGNIAADFKLERGNVDEAFKRSDVIVEGTWESARQWHAPIETIGSVTEWDMNGRLTIWTNSQTPFMGRNRYAVALDLPEKYVRLIQTEVGGGFGGKSSDENNALICAFLSRKAGKAVKLINEREDEFLATRPRIPMRYWVRLGFSKDGRIQAKDIKVIADNGAYTGKAIAVLGAATVRHDALYKYTDVRAESKLVYTNLVPTGAFRGFGNPSADWAVEQAWDLAAKKLGIDIVDLLLINATESGDVSPHNHQITSCELKQCIEKAADMIGWAEKRKNPKPNRGLGMACSVHVSGRRSFGDYDGSSAMLRINEDGRVTIITGEGEIGQGALTVLRQIAAAEIGVPFEDVDITRPDTDLSTHALGALASRVTYVAGNAVRNGAKELREKILVAAASQLMVEPDQLEVRDGKIMAKDDPQALEGGIPLGKIVWDNLYRPGGEPIVAVGMFDNPSEHPDHSRYGNESGSYNFVAEAAEIEVDPETGKVTIVDFVAVVDCGTVINPVLAVGQVQGAIAQGIGLTLSEYFAWTDGRPQNPNYGDYKIPTAGDMPPLRVAFADSYEPSGPFGAKGIGEIGLDPVSSVISNAIEDAVGIRIHTLPISSEKVYRAIKEKSKKGGAGHE